ncbi:putative cytochrome C peroxidase [Escherichia coli]|uniref:Putative cytochrome C peroxidase n=1 Tax=Escherichia coli TaxID=562 RepID=A0A376KJ42_ECOLX|nr:putative cytochrome C peroxidase [Escherichia coli]
MKMVSRITAIGLAGVAICYLGLSGYVWYHDNKRSKQADVQASAVSENNKVLGFLREKRMRLLPHTFGRITRLLLYSWRETVDGLRH